LYNNNVIYLRIASLATFNVPRLYPGVAGWRILLYGKLKSLHFNVEEDSALKTFRKSRKMIMQGPPWSL